MLVLQRYVGESIVIGPDIKVTVVRVSAQCPDCACRLGKGTVRIGIDAPREIAVDREEVQAQRRGCEGVI